MRRTLALLVAPPIETLSVKSSLRLAIVLRSTAGDNFLQYAAESNCKKMLFAPAVTNHIDERWQGELMYVISSSRGVYQWGGTMRVPASHRALLVALLPLVWLVNLLLLPLILLR